MQFTVVGSGFDMLPINAVAVIGSTDNPLGQRYTNDPWSLMTIVNKSDTFVEFSAAQPFDFSTGHNLGAILSADRSIIYWVNE